MANADVLGLAGKHALVVGGGSGIGRASALLLADAGADVVVGDLDPERAQAVRREIEATGARAGAVTGDATIDVAATDLVARAVAHLDGHLDILINIVGMAAWTRLFELDEATWQLDLSRNLTQHLFVSRAAARHMADHGTGGRIALVASVSGFYGAPNHGAYGAAKAGLMALARTMALEWAPHNIRVNTVAPDVIATPRVRASWAGREAEVADTTRTARIPLGRFGEPEEIAGPLVFLVSDLSSFVTGQNLIVDGGRRANFPSADPGM